MSSGFIGEYDQCHYKSKLFPEFLFDDSDAKYEYRDSGILEWFWLGLRVVFYSFFILLLSRYHYDFLNNNE